MITIDEQTAQLAWSACHAMAGEHFHHRNVQRQLMRAAAENGEHVAAWDHHGNAQFHASKAAAMRDAGNKLAEAINRTKMRSAA